jgi:hypothetical protein
MAQIMDENGVLKEKNSQSQVSKRRKVERDLGQAVYITKELYATRSLDKQEKEN